MSFTLEPPPQVSSDIPTWKKWVARLWQTIYAIPFTQSGTGAVATDLQTRGRLVVWADDFDTLQHAHDAVFALGGGIVQLSSGTYTTAPLTTKSGVIFRGMGIGATEIKLADNSNADFITSYNFATLTGNNKWLTSDGVQYALGFWDLRLNGNKANQTSGDGVKLYAKQLFIKCLIYDVYGIGWYSEAGDVAGQTDWTDLPEGLIEYLQVRNSGSYGIQWRGPHDANIKTMLANENGSDGIVFERTASTYSGAVDVGLLHSYANTGYGVTMNSGFQGRFREFISESNTKEGLTCAGNYCQFGLLQLYSNCTSSGSYNAIFSGTHNVSANTQVKDGSVGGIQVTGNYNQLLGLDLNGNSASTGVGLDLNGNFNHAQGHVHEFTGVGAIGLQTGNSTQLQHAQLSLGIRSCKTGWNNAVIGTYNTYDIDIFAAAGQTVMSGSGPNTSGTEDWRVKANDASSNQYSSTFSYESTNAIDLNSTALQTLNVTHNLIQTPLKSKVKLGVVYLGANTTWAWQQAPFVTAVSSTQISVAWKLGTAAGSATNADLIVNASL